MEFSLEQARALLERFDGQDISVSVVEHEGNLVAYETEYAEDGGTILAATDKPAAPQPKYFCPNCHLQILPTPQPDRLAAMELREAAKKLLSLIWETNFDEEVETDYERAVVALRDALIAEAERGTAP